MANDFQYIDNRINLPKIFISPQIFQGAHNLKINLRPVSSGSSLQIVSSKNLSVQEHEPGYWKHKITLILKVVISISKTNSTLFFTHSPPPPLPLSLSFISSPTYSQSLSVTLSICLFVSPSVSFSICLSFSPSMIYISV